MHASVFNLEGSHAKQSRESHHLSLPGAKYDAGGRITLHNDALRWVGVSEDMEHSCDVRIFKSGHTLPAPFRLKSMLLTKVVKPAEASERFPAGSQVCAASDLSSHCGSCSLA